LKKETKRVVAVVLPICFFAILLALAVLSVANDMYAFYKPVREVTVTITDVHTVDEISQLLFEKDIIYNPFCFSLYVKSKDKISELESFQGEITLSSNMSYREILAVFI